MSTGPGRRLRIFGVTLATDLELSEPLCESSAPPDLTLTLAQEPPIDPSGLSALVYESRECHASGQSLVRLFRVGETDVLRFAELADFYIAADRIVCNPAPAASPRLLEIQVLGLVLSFWLELQGVLALHASAVTVAGRAVAFLAGNQSGKTALAAALMSEGHGLLTDDVLPIEERNGTWLGRPGYPQMRMWPQVADHFVGGHQHLEAVHPEVPKLRVPVGAAGWGRFGTESRPLSYCYLPERSERYRQVTIEPLSPRDAVIELIRHSFTPRLAAAKDWQGRRLELFSRLVERVPVGRLRFPAGLERLPEVSGRVVEDLLSR